MPADRPYDVITFDCYGTLVDWERGIGSAFEAAAEQAGVSLDRERVLVRYAEVEPRVQSETFRTYASVLHETAQRVASSFGWELSQEDSAFLPESLPDWPPFADTVASLQRLVSEGYILGILSNVDDALLAQTRRHLKTDFDLTITAQQVGSYKPAHGHFDAARQRIGDKRWLHAAQSYFHDVVPAVDLGVPVAWINRKGELPSGAQRPNFEFHNLAEFADWLT
jgi:2-haloacid dehalogenase/putative hydrolase of the HAD superfamily